MKSVKNQIQNKTISRRKFMGSTAGALAGFVIVPRHVLGGPGQVPPSERVNLASIGAGGIAANNIRSCANPKNKIVANMVALCDVDDVQASAIYTEFPQAAKYKDFRIMLDKHHKEIDGVIIATPDHTHAVATMAAIQAGKGVYTQKPMTHSIYEARRLTEAARQAGVMTQMGNQGRSREGTQLIIEWISDGAIGAVREVHCWTSRPIWPQGIPRSTEKMDIPPTLDWDLWLGPAPERPYNSAYVPFKWRGFWDFGTGALGDMGCHLIDQPFCALKLGSPISVEATCTKITNDELRPLVEAETGPNASVIRYEFPARGEMPPVTLMWYDGGIRPFRPRDLEPERDFNMWNGMLFVGEESSILAGCYGDSPRIIPEAKMQAYKRPAKTLRRVPDGHEDDWLRSLKDGKPALSNFDYAGPLTEVVLLGNLAVRCDGKKLLWDAANMKVTNVPEANQYIQRTYRSGWTL